ncbi:hypothetical protein [Sediminicola luteus]|uniref:Uncharacterized protein n=1 Tax=Sediminicola luteus TaxID=319238 RepID=A0A2A4G4J1_9FLAO|nr:hypothetical protein [Sediminicola luteus]PCE62898.1 hypothetical protein B7P33_16615 [Sediminicola luteus]
MGLVKQWMFDNEYNNSLTEFLRQLLENDQLTGAIEGITKQILDKGIASLKGAQRPVIESFVENYTRNIECERCSNGNLSELTDYLFIEENGLCPMCEYDREKFMID